MGIKTIKNLKKKLKIKTIEPSGTRKIKGHYLQLKNNNIGELFIPGLSNEIVKNRTVKNRTVKSRTKRGGTRRRRRL
jgi:hypothetical protein